MREREKEIQREKREERREKKEERRETLIPINRLIISSLNNTDQLSKNASAIDTLPLLKSKLFLAR